MKEEQKKVIQVMVRAVLFVAQFGVPLCDSFVPFMAPLSLLRNAVVFSKCAALKVIFSSLDVHYWASLPIPMMFLIK